MSLRSHLRDCFFRFLRKALTHDEGKDAVAESLRGLLTPPPHAWAALRPAEVPYPEIGRPDGPIRTCDRDDIVFVTGRFRSGSTLLWNVFRQVPNCTSYYEPFNERQWFNPALRGERVDSSHRGVNDYWREYEGLEELGQFYREDWIRRGLYMDGRSWNPAMKALVERMIERAPGRPVLQFNRIDFRLPWFRHTFPRARIVHLFRHPRDQWCSTLISPESFGPKSGGLKDFAAVDKYYLRLWVNDLKYHFPFLGDDSLHPYRHHYWIWKLSYLYGVNYSNHSICFEDLVAHPRRELERLFVTLEIAVNNWTSLESLVEQPELGKWRRYAGDEWFRRQEIECEQVLADFLRSEQPSLSPRTSSAEALP